MRALGYLLRFDEVSVIASKAIDPTPHSGIEFLQLRASMGLSRRKSTIRGMDFQETPPLEAKLVAMRAGFNL
jgi:dTDP-4-dehydrorhamnose 3,5-epimerase-like enzyme